MSRDQRVRDNHALLAAQEEAKKLGRDLEVVFCVYPKTGYRTQVHYKFMLDGLRHAERDLASHNISFKLLVGQPKETLTEYLNTRDPAAVYFDFSPLKGPRELQKHLANQVDCPVYVVDTHNVIPVWVTSREREFAAHTIRRKVHKNLTEWLVEPDHITKQNSTKIDLSLNKSAWNEADNLVANMPKSDQIIEFKSGEVAANKVLQEFLNERLENFANMRNHPEVSATSDLSPYLHFGQISSLRVALEAIKKLDGQTPLLFEQPKMASASNQPSMLDGVNALLEEMIVRKELADNYCFYSSSYTTLEGAWSWATKSLNEHQSDVRNYIYTLDDLIEVKTHDPAWNAAQLQMMKTGKMHGYMRMYWAKKILEWSKSPEVALQNCIILNDTYSLDGADPNGYTGIMWSIAGVHDRAWTNRPIFGQIRYMNYDGLKRKFNIESYINKWS